MIATAKLIGSTELLASLQPRARTAHKGEFGHVLVIGGDEGMAGAVRLAAEAAARTGAGLVSVATRRAHAHSIVSGCPEVMCYGIEQPEQLIPLLAKATVLVIGPGLGKNTWSKALFNTAILSKLPMVVDADALNLLAEQPRTHQHWVLTPHPGEAARLLASSVAVVQADRPAAIRSLQLQYQGVMVLKGAHSLILGDELWLCDVANPAMASGGMGDALSGVIAGLLAQGLSLETAASLGVYVHAQAGLQAAQDGERGMLASDLIAKLRQVVNPCR